MASAACCHPLIPPKPRMAVGFASHAADTPLSAGTPPITRMAVGFASHAAALTKSQVHLLSSGNALDACFRPTRPERIQGEFNRQKGCWVVGMVFTSMISTKQLCCSCCYIMQVFGWQLKLT